MYIPGTADGTGEYGMGKICMGAALAVLVFAAALHIVYMWKKARPRYRALQGMAEDNGSAIFLFSTRGRCLFTNPKGCELFRVPAGDGREKVEGFFRKWLEEKGRTTEDSTEWEQIYSLDGEDRFFQVRFRRLRNGRNRVTGYAFLLTDQTDEIKKFREEQYLATHDRLTGFYNSEYFFQKAAELLKNDPETERYMVCISIRNFKLVNELFGEETGDRVLLAQAAQLKYADSDNCLHGRITRDKFALLIPRENFNPELAANSTGKLQYVVDNSNYKLQISVGVYRILDSLENPSMMFDKACLAIESEGGDYQKTAVFYDVGMMEQLLHEKSIISEFESAIEKRQFDMFLQAQVAADGSLLGAEALVRWHHPEKGIVFPVNFISVIERTGLIIRLDRYMWELAAGKLRQWKEWGRDNLFISVNISAKDFYYADLYAEFTELVKRYEISPRNLKLEITETALMTDVEQHLATLAKLQEQGFEVEIDDFGSGYSSLNMLKDIKANVLKIDMLFLRETENQERSRTILNSIISMSRALGMEVITEGVETEEQVEMLRSMGCDAFQGYYFSKPVPVEEFEAKYLSRVEAAR